MGRRAFLTRAAAISGLGMGALSPTVAKTPDRLKVAVFSGMFKTTPLPTAMAQAAKIGYDAIEIQVAAGSPHLDINPSPERADEIKKMAADNGIEVCLIYTPIGGNVLADQAQRTKGLDDVARFLEIADRASCKMLKVTAGRLKNSAYRDDEARTVAEWLAAACDRAEKHGSRIVAEIHFGQYCETVAMARKIIDLVDRKNFGVIHDAGNLMITGDIYGEDSVKILGDRIFHVHVKDMVKVGAEDPVGHNYLAGRFKRAPLNEGNVDHRPLFASLKKIGFGGYLSCEATGGDDPATVAKHEYDEVLKLLGPA